MAKYQKHSAWTKERARRMVQKGVSIDEIAKRLGIKPGTVRAWYAGMRMFVAGAP